MEELLGALIEAFIEVTLQFVIRLLFRKAVRGTRSRSAARHHQMLAGPEQ